MPDRREAHRRGVDRWGLVCSETRHGAKEINKIDFIFREPFGNPSVQWLRSKDGCGKVGDEHEHELGSISYSEGAAVKPASDD